MAGSVLTIALETVRDLLMEETKFLLGVRGEVEEIEKELKRMKIFVEYADSKQDEDKMLHHRVIEIRELADEVEYVLETFAIEVRSRKKRGGIQNALKTYASSFNKAIALHKVGSEIVSIKTKITNLSNSLSIYDLGQAQSLDSAQERQLQRWQRLTFPHFEEDFVGMEEDIRLLVFHLVNYNREEENQRRWPRVVSICGMGGLGKTSLAKKVYNHNEVRRCFDLFAWACITQQWQPRDILQEILIGLVPQNKEEITKMRDRELFEKLYQVQGNKKCLIVIDDIWSMDAWDSLRPAFPDGSKVLLTTRHKEVALHADPSGYLHEPECLNEEDSWNLLQKKAFPLRDIGTGFIIDPSMEELGREMVKQCGGLPLAVVVLGGILVLKHTSKEWEMVFQNIKSYLMRGEGTKREDGGVLGVLALSYKNLPYHLKACFLYLGHFLEDSEIKVEKLYHMWVAERLVSLDERREGEKMVDVAERCLGELAQRYLVQVHLKEASTARTRFKSCKLHDRMRDLCLSKIIEQNSLKVFSDSHRGSTGFLHGNESRALLRKGESTTFKKQSARHVRSILFFGNWLNPWYEIRAMGINNFKLVRVLVLEKVIYVDNVLEGIGELRQLRYLSFRNAWLKKLPSSIGNLANLQTLDLRTISHEVIPDVLWKLQKLRHLYLPASTDTKELRLDGLSILETLVNFKSDYCSVQDFIQLNNLQKLKASLFMEHSNVYDLAKFITLINPLLQYSNLQVLYVSFRQEEALTILRNLTGCHHIYKLELSGYISKLPEYFHFSSSLTKLSLEFSQFEEDPMPTLEKLPTLISLYLGCQAFMGKEMVCSAISFPQLTRLILDSLYSLENWRVDEGAFPKLSRLNIDHCDGLKMIPDGLTFITTLKELNIVSMPDEFINKIRVIDGIEGEDFHKVRHVPSVKFKVS